MEPLSFAEACLGSGEYLPLLERGLMHTHVTVRELARDILDQAMSSPDELTRLPFALREQVKRLHQQAHSSEDGSGGGSSRNGADSSGQSLSFSDPTFPKRTSETPETVRTVSKNVCKVPTYSTPQKDRKEEVPTYRTAPAETPDQEALARFQRLAADQQDDLSCRLRALPVEQRRDVLAEWSVRCAAGVVRDAAAYLFGLIRKALQGTFRLWAARKNRAQEDPACRVQEAPPRPPSTAEPPVPEPADEPASREVAQVYLQRIQAMLQGTASAAPATHTRKPPETRHSRTPTPLARALEQAMPATSPLRPLAAFFAPVIETIR
jgi:hypothetical protein